MCLLSRLSSQTPSAPPTREWSMTAEPGNCPTTSNAAPTTRPAPPTASTWSASSRTVRTGVWWWWWWWTGSPVLWEGDFPPRRPGHRHSAALNHTSIKTEMDPLSYLAQTEQQLSFIIARGGRFPDGINKRIRHYRRRRRTKESRVLKVLADHIVSGLLRSQHPTVTTFIQTLL